ncbi:hypothetical protein MAR_020703 [Mya arenaria]|uniref:Protein quiver n=1 Tax=Mya arenaria TaxID=6604 RepID=A0ABY7E844_MYAAR|nr:protein quiver-like [Mya arenaria]WAR05334.1 hypothetical protein MAR_020703 [Mya arenaria]
MIEMSYNSFLAICLTVIYLTRKVESLECYSCTSNEDPKCGVEFKYSGTAGDKYKAPCEGGTAACRKLVTQDAHKGAEMVVRSCWNASTVENLDKDFLDCSTLMSSTGEVCYCQSDSCNGAQLMYASLVTVLTGLSFLVL